MTTRTRKFTNPFGRDIFEASIGNTKYQCYSLEDLKKCLKEHKEYDNSGAERDYGTGTYNGD